MNNFVPRQCEHIRDTGVRCGSPAMRDRDFCYYHRRLHTSILPGDSEYVMPALETEQAVQLATTHIVRAMLKGKIDRRDAMSMLAAIRIAAASIRNTPPIERDIDFMELQLTPAMERECSTPPDVLEQVSSPAPVATPSLTMMSMMNPKQAAGRISLAASAPQAVWEQAPPPAPATGVEASQREREHVIEECHGERGRTSESNHHANADPNRNVPGNSHLGVYVDDARSRASVSGNSRQRRAASRRAERLMQQIQKIQGSRVPTAIASQ